MITPEGVVEFVDNRKGLHIVDFDQLSEIALQVQGSSFSDSYDVIWRGFLIIPWDGSVGVETVLAQPLSYIGTVFGVGCWSGNGPRLAQ